MDSPLIPVKTPDGVAELSSRQRRVSQRHRTVLLLVDGRRSEAQVRSMAVQAGAPEGCFDELLALGLIAQPQSQPQPQPADVPADEALHVDLPLEPAAVALPPALPAVHDESVLPPARTLQPESVLTDSMLAEGPPADSGLSDFDALEAAGGDATLEEARHLLMRAVRTEAPVAGTLTLMRLKRARSRADLAGLIDEVESRIVRPHRSLAAQQTLSRARSLLGAAPDGAPVG